VKRPQKEHETTPKVTGRTLIKNSNEELFIPIYKEQCGSTEVQDQEVLEDTPNSERPLQIVDTQESMGVPHPVHSDKSEGLSSGSYEPAESKSDRPKESPTVESCQGCRYVDFDGGVPYCCDTGFDLADMDECLKGHPLPLPADHNEEDDIPF
jgi:hypothetical protein